MKTESIAPFAGFLLLVLASACSEPETETEGVAQNTLEPETDTESEQATSTQVLLEQLEETRGDRDATGTDSDVFSRLELCEVDDTTEARIREVDAQLDELLLRYTERHPRVIATRQVLDDLVQAALEDCVERLQ
jgi:hypothetical protein